MSRRQKLALGLFLALLLGWLYHGPIGTADRFAATVESRARAELVRNEMGMITARLERRPLTRTLVLSGPADDFQRGELVRIMGEIPGVGSVRWDPASLPAEEIR